MDKKGRLDGLMSLMLAVLAMASTVLIIPIALNSMNILEISTAYNQTYDSSNATWWNSSWSSQPTAEPLEVNLTQDSVILNTLGQLTSSMPLAAILFPLMLVLAGYMAVRFLRSTDYPEENEQSAFKSISIVEASKPQSDQVIKQKSHQNVKPSEHKKFNESESSSRFDKLD